MTELDCIFCKIVNGEAEATILDHTLATVIFKPLNPYVPGHALVVPNLHSTDATENLLLTAIVFRAAAEYGHKLGKPFNIVSSVGAKATQTIFHLHVHVIPRGPGDGVESDWPWSR